MFLEFEVKDLFVIKKKEWVDVGEEVVLLKSIR